MPSHSAQRAKFTKSAAAVHRRRRYFCLLQSLGSIIDHWGDYGDSLVPFAGPGHWHDMDMLLIGSDCVSAEEERTQMAIWSISASPLVSQAGAHTEVEAGVLPLPFPPRRAHVRTG